MKRDSDSAWPEVISVPRQLIQDVGVLCAAAIVLKRHVPEATPRQIAQVLGVSDRTIRRLKTVIEQHLVDSVEWPQPKPGRPPRKKRRRRKRQKTEQRPTEVQQSQEDKPTKPDPVADAVIMLPTRQYKTKGEEFPVSKELFEELSQLYPDVDLSRELRKMRAWLLGNPDRRKTYRGMKRFITNWLNKQVDLIQPRRQGKNAWWRTAFLTNGATDDA